MQETTDAGSIPGQEDPLEEGMATHSRILGWRIPWTEKPGGLQSMGSQRVGHDSSDLKTYTQRWLRVHSLEWEKISNNKWSY